MSSPFFPKQEEAHACCLRWWNKQIFLLFSSVYLFMLLFLQQAPKSPACLLGPISGGLGGIHVYQNQTPRKKRVVILDHIMHLFIVSHLFVFVFVLEKVLG